MTQEMRGKVFVVTGASEGIGFATAALLATRGARVYITARRRAVLEEAVSQIGANAIPVIADSSSIADLRALYQRVADDAGTIDGIVANAGVAGFQPMGAITEPEFDRIVSINLKGTLFTVQEGLSVLKDGASIVLLSSVSAFKGDRTASVYSATKAAIRSFARCWAADLADRSIRVNALSPGAIWTEAFDRAFPTQEQRDQLLAKVAVPTPAGRTGDPTEVAAAACFLLSDESSFMTGADLHVDGGMAQI